MRALDMPGAGAWMRGDLTPQGYCLSDEERRRLAVGLRSRRRRDTFKVATVWLLAVGSLLAAGATTVALVLGGMLAAVCATVATTKFCLPSVMFAWLEGRGAPKKPITT
jgi:hypothetical protein